MVIKGGFWFWFCCCCLTMCASSGLGFIPFLDFPGRVLRGVGSAGREMGCFGGSCGVWRRGIGSVPAR